MSSGFSTRGLTMLKHETQEPGSVIDSHDCTPPFRLLALPAELREEVWKFALGGIVIEIGQEHRPRIPEPALTWTSRQIRAETVPVFWAYSIFDGLHVPMLRFFGVIGRRNVELIRHVRHTGHVGLNTLYGIRLTLWILGRAYETLGLRLDSLYIPVLIEGEGETWVNLQETSHLKEIRQGPGLSKMPNVRRVSDTAV
ncbi:hypothetical protein BX600DRAFT_472617 [Xylariales sp. PMI_506]|nr:hypothetical protein BX600DRAFT_472617 [Xylariales sp. PMI_506]